MASTISKMPTVQYPVDKEIELKIRVRLASKEDEEYFFSEDGSLQTGLLLDVFDMLDMINKHIITINGLTFAEMQKRIGDEL